jgi:hypothetical protein
MVTVFEKHKLYERGYYSECKKLTFVQFHLEDGLGIPEV